jgi:hypothetical protein
MRSRLILSIEETVASTMNPTPLTPGSELGDESADDAVDGGEVGFTVQ